LQGSNKKDEEENGNEKWFEEELKENQRKVLEGILLSVSC